MTRRYYSKPVTKSHASVALLFIVLSAVMTWPLAYNLERAVAWPGDPYINTWVLDWDWYATFHQPLSLFEANAFHPARESLAYSENLYGIALLLFPLRALGVSALAAYNIAMLAGYAFSGFAAYLLGRHVSGSLWAGTAAGVFYAFLPFRFTHASHVQYVWGGWLPLLLLMLFRYAERPTRTRAAAFAAVFLLNGLTNIHALLFGTVAIAATAVLMCGGRLSAGRRGLRARHHTEKPLLHHALFPLVAVIMLLPFLLPYVDVAKRYGMVRRWHETRLFSARPQDWLVSNTVNHAYRALEDTNVNPERWLFPGALCMVIGIFALAARGRAATAALLWILIGFIGSLGIHNVFHRFLFVHVIGFRAIRVPARWAMITYVGLAVAVALGTAVLSHKRAWIGIVITAAFIVEMWSAPYLWYMAVDEFPPVYRWIAQTKPRAILELPMGGDVEYSYMLHATAHHRPMLNGVSGFAPREYTRFVASSQREPIADTFIDDLRRAGCDIVVIHGDVVNSARQRWLARELERGRLAFVRRFENGGSGDWVFHVEDRPLSGKVTPLPLSLEAFLRGEPTFAEVPFGLLDQPLPGARLRGATSFSGWALSPYGLREVNILFNNGLIRERATLSANPYLNHVFPFYDVTTRPVFTLDLSQRPRGVWQHTDVQTEIIDGHGRRVRLPDRFIEWQ